jgi:hypothetical protein
MPIDENLVKLYWKEVLALCDQLVAHAAYMREWASELPSVNDGSDVLKQVIDRLVNRSGGSILANALREDGPHSLKDQYHDIGGQLVSRVNNRFLGGLKLLIQELDERIRSLPPSEYGPRVLALLAGDNLHDLAARFGSLTAAWDQLVLLKHEAAVPDRRKSRLDSWFTALVGYSERFLRNIVGVTVKIAGRELVPDALLACYESPELGVPHPTPAQIIELSSADMAITESIMTFMDRGGRHTTHFAATFAEALGTSLFPEQERGVQPGILTELPTFGESSETTWIALLDARKAIIHETALALRTNVDVAPQSKLYGLSKRELELITEFLCAFCFSFATRILGAVSHRAETQHPRLVEELRHRHSGELRVLVMVLLTSRRYELAWALAEAALAIEPTGSPGTILRLNSLIARQRMGRDYFDAAELMRLDTQGEPRYQLLKEVLLGNLDRDVLEPLLNSTITAGDLTIDELEAWPGLEALRATAWWTDWRRQYASGY